MGSLMRRKSGASPPACDALLRPAALSFPLPTRFHTALSLALGDTGSTAFNASDFKDFAPGTDLLSLSRITSSKPGGTPFAALDASYENITTIPVMWQ
jgi:hypothetical protein